MPQPIDVSTEVAKLAAAQRAQAMADRASLVAQHRHTKEVQEHDVEAETQVHQTPETRGEEVDAEGHRSNPYVGRKRKKKKKKDSETRDPSKLFYSVDEKTEIVDDDEGQNLDITI